MILQALEKVQDAALDTSTRTLIEQAERQGIPWSRVSSDSQCVQFGYGRDLHLYCDGLTDLDPHFASRLLADRALYYSILRRSRIPVARSHQSHSHQPVFAKRYRLSIRDEVFDQTLRLAVAPGQDDETVTETVHPDTRAMAERIARVLGLRTAEIDYACDDITRSCIVRAGEVLDVALPDGDLEASGPDESKLAPPNIGSLYPTGQDGRIPIAAITGTSGKTTTCRMLAQILRSAELTVGVATTDSIVINETIVSQDDYAGISGARAVLSDPSVEAAVLETARRGLLKRGMAFEHCDVAAVTNIGDDHLGEFGLNNRADMARLKRRVRGSRARGHRAQCR